MKKEEVPQDKGNLSKNNMRELCYATDKDGNYTTELSTGWEPKSIALDKSLEDIKERTEQAKNDIKIGVSSPIVYFMELNRMDWNILSSYVGMFKWRVKRHAKPKIFSKLKESILKKYADVFEISVEDLKNFKGE